MKVTEGTFEEFQVDICKHFVPNSSEIWSGNPQELLDQRKS